MGAPAPASLPGLSVFDMSGRTKLRFAGPQALWFLDQLVTNKVDELPPGRGAEALLLTPNGKISSHLRILHRPDSGETPDVLVDAPDGHAQRLLDFFGMRVFATKVTISDVSEDFAILRLLGAMAADVAADVFAIEQPVDAEHASTLFSDEVIDGLTVGVSMPAPGLDLWVPAGSGPQATEGLTNAGAQLLSGPEYEALRIAGGVAEFGVDFDDGYLPQEAALERAVHFSKGCYLGQEAVAMAQRGRIKRRLRHLGFQGLGGNGKVVHGGTEAGRVSSAAETDGGWFGIGTVKADVPVGETVQVLLEAVEAVGDVSSGEGVGVAALVGELPGTTYGPRVPSARELREKLEGG